MTTPFGRLSQSNRGRIVVTQRPASGAAKRCRTRSNRGSPNGSKTSFGRGNGALQARVDGDRLPERAAGCFEHCFENVVGVAAVVKQCVIVHSGVSGDRTPKFFRQLYVEGADLFGR